jgi:hypothetical protein
LYKLFLFLPNILNKFDFHTSRFEKTIIEETEIVLNILSSIKFVRKRAKRKMLTSRLSARLDKCKIRDRDVVQLLTMCVKVISLNTNDVFVNRTSIVYTKYSTNISKKIIQAT